MNGRNHDNARKDDAALPLIVAPPLSPSVTFDADVAFAFSLPLEPPVRHKRA